MIVKAYPQGNTENTIKFIKYLQEQCPQVKIAIIWDGASYHRSHEFREDLEEVNQGKAEFARSLDLKSSSSERTDSREEWSITCIRLAQRCS